MAGELVVGIFLFTGVGIELVCCLGVVVMRSAYARLHYTGPAGLGALLVAIAILIHEGFSLIGDKALLIATFILVISPVLSHVTARAARIRELGGVTTDQRPHPDP